MWNYGLGKRKVYPGKYEGAYSRSVGFPNKRFTIKSKYFGKKARGYYRIGGYYGRFGRGGMGVNKPEFKFKDTDITTPIDVGLGGTLISPSLNLVNQGNGESEMIGRKLTIKRISIRGSINFQANTAVGLANIGSDNRVRLMMVLDTQCNGSSATAALLMENQEIHSFLNLENKSRFKVLKEWTIVNDAVVGHNNTGNVYYCGLRKLPFKWTKKCNIKIEYGQQSGGARDITEVRSNNIFLIAFSEAAPTASSQVECRVRIRFSDD